MYFYSSLYLPKEIMNFKWENTCDGVLGKAQSYLQGPSVLIENKNILIFRYFLELHFWPSAFLAN